VRYALALLAVLSFIAAPTASAAKPALDITPNHVNFGNQPFESLTERSFTITNQSSETLAVTIDQVRVPDDFSPGQIQSTCTLIDPTLLAPGESCTHFVTYRPTPFFEGLEVAILRVTARDAAGNIVYTDDVRMTGRGV
jgi:hypothetical protein